MAFISRRELTDYVLTSAKATEARRHILLQRAADRPSVFLSHSHHDQKIVGAAINFLASQGVDVYVDWLDDGMPAKTNADTATRIKRAIKANGKFVLLATEASLASRWVPWELGCADGVKSIENMAILGVSEDGRDFPGNEYLALYPTIEKSMSGWGVYPPQSSSGVGLAFWLRQ